MASKQGDPDPRVKVYRALGHIRESYHFAPLSEGPTEGRVIPKNLVLMALTNILGTNHLLVGEPGWGKTTGAKIIASKISGLPYDLFDALEIRGHPQKYEEKVVARPHYGHLATGKEEVIWQGSFALPTLIVDECNRLPLDSQDVILQGIDTGRWNYLNYSLYEGKKPTYATMNERTGNHENGFLPALKDRFDIVTEQVPLSTLAIFDLRAAKLAVNGQLCDYGYVEAALEALARDYGAFKKSLDKRPIAGHLTSEELRQIQDEIFRMDFLKTGNDPMLFLQAFAAEVNFSVKYGYKRVSDPISDDTHDKRFAGVCLKHSFSPRSMMATMAYTQALAWFLRQDISMDHVRYVLPHIIAHKADFVQDYSDKHGNTDRMDGDNNNIFLAKQLVREVHDRYVACIQPMKNFISMVQAGKITDGHIRDKKVEVQDSAGQTQVIKLDPNEHDHPLMKDLIRQLLSPERAFYEEEEKDAIAGIVDAATKKK